MNIPSIMPCSDRECQQRLLYDACKNYAALKSLKLHKNVKALMIRAINNHLGYQYKRRDGVRTKYSAIERQQAFRHCKWNASLGRCAHTLLPLASPSTSTAVTLIPSIPDPLVAAAPPISAAPSSPAALVSSSLVAYAAMPDALSMAAATLQDEDDVLEVHDDDEEEAQEKETADEEASHEEHEEVEEEEVKEEEEDRSRQRPASSSLLIQSITSSSLADDLQHNDFQRVAETVLQHNPTASASFSSSGVQWSGVAKEFPHLTVAQIKLRWQSFLDRQLSIQKACNPFSSSSFFSPSSSSSSCSSSSASLSSSSSCPASASKPKPDAANSFSALLSEPHLSLVPLYACPSNLPPMLKSVQEELLKDGTRYTGLWIFCCPRDHEHTKSKGGCYQMHGNGTWIVENAIKRGMFPFSDASPVDASAAATASCYQCDWFIYEGSFTHGEFGPKGTLQCADFIYVGEFNKTLHKTQIVGLGVKYFRADERLFVGACLGDREMTGRMEYANGDVFMGSFNHQHRPRQWGEMRYANSSTVSYLGNFKDGKRDGVGIVTLKNQTPIFTRMRDDKIVAQVPVA